MSLRAVILIVLSDTELSGYEITKEFDTVLGYFWNAKHQQVYRELRKLNDEGLVRCRVEPQDGKPDRKVYSISASGRQALQASLEAPAPKPAFRSPLLLKVYAGMMLGPRRLLEHVDNYWRDNRATLTRFRAIAKEHYPEGVDEMPSWKKLAYLTLRFGILRREADLRWAAEAREVIGTIKSKS